MKQERIESESERVMNLENIADDVRLVVAVDDDDFDSSLFPSSSSVVLCRICHEEEDESSTSMESPCGCSGTLKFAHRGCIQKWCDEKGSTVCEICLQKFEPGYTVPPKLALLDVAVTIRGSLEVPRLNYEAEDTGDIDDEPDSDYPECSPPSDRTAIWFRSIALIYMLMLLARQLIIVASNREGNYPFALTTVLLLRASGIVLPFYFIMRVVAAIQKAQQRHRLRLQLHRRRAASPMQRDEEDELLPQQHTVTRLHS